LSVRRGREIARDDAAVREGIPDVLRYKMWKDSTSDNCRMTAVRRFAIILQSFEALYQVLLFRDGHIGG
jgi:hypothetical protein